MISKLQTASGTFWVHVYSFFVHVQPMWVVVIHNSGHVAVVVPIYTRMAVFKLLKNVLCCILCIFVALFLLRVLP